MIRPSGAFAVLISGFLQDKPVAVLREIHHGNHKDNIPSAVPALCDCTRYPHRSWVLANAGRSLSISNMCRKWHRCQETNCGRRTYTWPDSGRWFDHIHPEARCEAGGCHRTARNRYLLIIPDIITQTSATNKYMPE